MKLDDWINTEEGIRNKLLGEWCRDSEFLHPGAALLDELVREAASRLAHELAGVPEITAVVGVISHFGEILVTTSLPKGISSPTIPKEFATFQVLQFGVSEAKNEFLQCLEFVYRAASMSQEIIHRDLTRSEQQLQNIRSPYYCDTPAKWISWSLANAKNRGVLIGGPFVRFRNDIHDAVERFIQEQNVSTGEPDPASLCRLRESLECVFSAHMPK